MVFHRIEPGHTADDEGLVCNTPNSAQRTAGGRIRTHGLGIDAVRDDRDAIGRQAARDGIGAHGTGIGDDEIGAPGKPSFRPVGEGVQRIVVSQLHPPGSQAEHEFRLQMPRQQQRCERRLHRQKGVDQVRAFAQKKAPQLPQRRHHVPTARLSDGQRRTPLSPSNPSSAPPAYSTATATSCPCRARPAASTASCRWLPPTPRSRTRKSIFMRATRLAAATSLRPFARRPRD